MQVKIPDNINTIVHIGAGEGSELPTYLESAAARIVLVEPNPKLAEYLRDQVDNNDRVIVLESAVGGASAGKTLCVYSLTHTSSVYPLGELKSLYPGLKLLRSYDVEQEKFSQLLKKLDLRGSNNFLVVQAPGVEADVLEGLTHSNYLESFSQVYLQETRHGLYQCPEVDVVSKLLQLGYNLDSSSNESTATLIHAHLDSGRLALSRLTESLDVLSKKYEKECAAHIKTKKNLDGYKERSEQKLKNLEGQLARKESELVNMKEQLSEQAQKNQKALNSLISDHKEQLLKIEDISGSKLNAVQLNLSDAIDKQAEAEVKNQNLLQNLDEVNDRLDKALQSKKVLENTLQPLGKKVLQLSSLEKQVDEHKKRAEDVEKELKSFKQAAEKDLQNEKDAHKALQDECCQLRESLSETKKSLEDNKAWFASRKKQAEQLKLEVEELRAQLLRSEQLASGFEAIKQQLEQLGSKVTSHVDKSLENSNKKLESSMGLNQYLATGAMPLSVQERPLAPGAALFLAEKIEANDYDLIVSLGAGSTTTLVAKSILNKMHRLVGGEGLALPSGGGKASSEVVAPSQRDLPVRVVVFEHDKSCVEKIRTQASSNQLSSLVKVFHSPLVDYKHSGSDFLHYDCEAELKRMADYLDGRPSRLLIIVNGPPSMVGPKSFYPALPKVLNHFSQHALDVVVSSITRQDQRDVIDEWCSQLQKRSLTFKRYDKLDFSISTLEINKQ